MPAAASPAVPASVRDQLQTTLGAAYTLGRELGGGGMSRVFVAREEALGREVVVKVLAPELAQGLSAERFAREIRLAAGLQEPHIVPVLAAGVTLDGLPYYTMPFVRGESLRTRLAAGPVPLAEAVSVLRDVARALAYAHRQGVVHRDVKPENVLLSEGTAVVTDFGIAKALQASKTQAPGGPFGAAGGTLTQLGTSLGTPAYMAPEQALGDPTDHRADLYAWGLVAYEVLAGRHPFADRASAQQLVTAQITEVPRPLADARPGLPPPLAAFVMACLAKDPAARPADATAVLAALEAVGSGGAFAAPPAGVGMAPAAGRRRRAAAAGALVLAVAAGAALVARGRADSATAAGAAAPDAAAVRSIAVLPFEHLGDTADAYFADGMSDAVRGKLTALPGVAVIARASSMTYGGGAKPPAEIARELGVRYLLTGTVRFVGSGAARRVQVSPELVEVTGGAPPQSRWQQPFDAEVTDVFRVQSDIAGRVADAMQVALGGEGRARLAAVPTRNAAAYDAFLRGEAAGGALSAADPNALRRALGYYAQAVALDTGFAEAWAQRARTASLLYFNGGPTPALAREARTAADRALALAPEHPAGHLALGDFHTMVGGDQRRALAAYEAGRRLAPGNADLLAGVAFSEQWVGRSAEAVRDFRAAAALDPRSVATARRLGVALLWARRYPEARAASDRALALAPANPVMIQTRAMVELAEGDLAGARRVLAAAPPELDPDVLVAVMGNFWDVGWALDDAGQRRLLALRPAAFDGDRGAWGWVVAQTYAQRGDGARARAYADTARVALEAQLRAAPDDAQTRVIYGLVLAAVGRNADAVREAERGAALLPVSRDAFRGPYLQHQLARVYLLAGQPERALDTLEPLLRMPYYLSRAWLRIDPTFAPLRGDPRFERLAAER